MIIAICDDEHKECAKVRDYVKNIPQLAEYDVQVDTYEPDDFEKMITRLEEADEQGSDNKGSSAEEKPEIEKPDIVIMDIEFAGKDYDGIALTKRLNCVSEKTQVIYLTHILEFAPEVYDTDHCYFVMKNNMEVMLAKAVEKALDIYKAFEDQTPLEIMSEGHKLFISQNDICFVEKKQRQTIIHTVTDNYSCYDSISSLDKRLSGSMVRCHGGYIVNLARIAYLGGDRIILDEPKQEIPVGKTYKEQTKKAYLKYWMRRM